MAQRPSLLWHRWFGVLGGAWLFLIALTGSILVFYAEIDHALNPTLHRAPAAAAGPPQVAAAIRNAEAAWPGAEVRFVRLPPEPDGTLTIFLSDRPDSPGAVGDKGREVYADPATGRLLGTRVFGAWVFDTAHIMPFLYKLHYTLHAGETVAWLLGILALLWFVDHFVAVPLALRSAKRWTDMFRLRRGARGHKLNFQLHRAAAMWLLPVTAMLAFSGVYFNLYDEFKAALSVVSAPTPEAAEHLPGLPQPLYAPPVDADAALTSVTGRGLRASGLGYDPAKGLWTVRVHDRRDIVADYGARALTVDARTGRVVADQHFADGSAGDVIMAWQYPLHSGKAFGWAGRILILLAGIATCALVVTGYLVWWRKRRAAHRRPVHPAADVPLEAVQPS